MRERALDNAIQFQDVTADGHKECYSFAVPYGSFSSLISTRQVESDRIVQLALGLLKYSTGTILTINENVAALTTEELNKLRMRISVVFPSGGLISNLKAWENLLLPLEYHSKLSPALIHERGLTMLERVGYNGELLALPGHMSLYEKRLVGVARGMISDPELILYNNIFDGLTDSEKENISTIITEFHREKPGRTSLFMTSNHEALKEVAFDYHVILKGNEFHG